VHVYLFSHILHLCYNLSLSFLYATASTSIYTLSLHDALPIYLPPREISMKDVFRSGDSSKKFKIAEGQWYRYAPSYVKLLRRIKIGRAVQQECRDRSRMPSSA